MESCAQIAGACLEQTTWLRRNLAVREEEPAVTVGTKEKEGSGGLILGGQIYLLVTTILLLYKYCVGNCPFLWYI